MRKIAILAGAMLGLAAASFAHASNFSEHETPGILANVEIIVVTEDSTPTVADAREIELHLTSIKNSTEFAIAVIHDEDRGLHEASTLRMPERASAAQTVMLLGLDSLNCAPAPAAILSGLPGGGVGRPQYLSPRSLGDP